MPKPAKIHQLARDVRGEPADAAPQNVLAGSGAARVWNAFSDASGRFHAGFWQGEPGRLAVDYTETELCVVVVGRVRLTDEKNASAEFGPGEAFVIESGFRGVWESLGRVTKIYAVLDPEA
jgi:uncharacterized cupin superfamily protein